MIPTLALLLYLRSRLGHDGRQKNGKGRFLKKEMSELGLLAGGRLEPCPELPEISAKDMLTDVPPTGVKVLCWMQKTRLQPVTGARFLIAVVAVELA